jgi:hypothetical protein
MSNLTFQMLLQCKYRGDDNDVDQLNIEILVDDNWQDFTIANNTPGFDVFMYAILTCQHTYFRNNAAEYDLVLGSSEGLITVSTDEHRSISSLHADFKGQLEKGIVNVEAVDSIIARMDLCPVSINLKDIIDRKTTVVFE